MISLTQISLTQIPLFQTALTETGLALIRLTQRVTSNIQYPKRVVHFHFHFRLVTHERKRMIGGGLPGL
jgi:hypothetical protein